MHVQVVGYAAKYKLDALKLAILQYLIWRRAQPPPRPLPGGVHRSGHPRRLGSHPLRRARLGRGGLHPADRRAQKLGVHVDPSRAAILLSLEAVFAVLAGLAYARRTTQLTRILGVPPYVRRHDALANAWLWGKKE